MNLTPMSSGLSNLNKAQTTELVTSTCDVRGSENQQVQCTNMVVDQPTWAGNLVSNSGDVSTFLRKVPANLTEQDFCTYVLVLLVKWVLCFYLAAN